MPLRILMLFALCWHTCCFAQQLPHSCHGPSSAHRNSYRTTVASPAENNYDVKYVKLDLAVTNLSTTISGNAITRAVSVIPSMSSYVFELDTLLTIDSVLINGIQRPFSSASAIRTVTFASPISSGTTFTAQVYYHGTPLSGNLFDIRGINTTFDSTWFAYTTFTLSEPYSAYEWWPCKQALTDKIDSADIWITVPDSLKAGSNGILQNVTTIDATHKRYEWKERLPVDYYLLSLAVAPYIDYSFYAHFTGSTDSVLIQNYVYSNPAVLPAYKPALDTTGLMIDYFSTLFGRYPFWKEKYGHSMVYMFGGMEHQTMTTIGSYACRPEVIAHELVHQWFGDNVTCATWSDIMVNEGFASYGSYLFKDHFRDHFDAINEMYYTQEFVKTYDTGTIYAYDTSSEGRIFDGRLSYAKGECLIHMLRAVFQYDDSAFFRVFRTYQQQHQYGNGTIEDFKNTAKTMYGTTINSINLDTFFYQWAYREGCPVYTVHWNQVGTDVFVKIDQVTTVPSSVSYFTLPIDMTLYGSGSAYLYKWVINNSPSQTYHFTWTYTTPMTDLYLDPAIWLLYKLDTIIHDPTLGVNSIQLPQVTVIPNPATTNWQVTNIPSDCTLMLADNFGRQLWQLSNTGSTLSISADKLPPGLYILRITSPDGTVSTHKLMKQ